MDIDKVKQRLRNYNLKPNFTYGQNFLVDESVLGEIVSAAEIISANRILEIGPGVGNLTEKLLATGANVFSIEKDPKFLPVLKALQSKHRNFDFTVGDFLDLDLEKYYKSTNKTNQCMSANNFKSNPQSSANQDDIRKSGSGYKVVANIPYFITGKILRKLFSAKHKPSRIILLTQKEVADSIIAGKGKMSLIGISVQVHGQPKKIKTIKAESFYPAPKVDSAILKIEVYKKPKYIIKDEEKFFKIVKACFLGKRKQIHNTLVNNLRLEKQTVEEILKKLNINPKSRPQELSIEDWMRLDNTIER